MLEQDLVDGLNVALNESDLLDIEVDGAERTAQVVFRVLTLNEAGAEPVNRMVHVVLSEVTRIAASLRHGRWDEEDAPIEPFELSDVGRVVRSFGGGAIYGWEFVNPPESSWTAWRNRLSIDEILAPVGEDDVLEVFQEGATESRHLDVRIWFRRLTISNAEGEIDPAAFAAGGVRWWDAMYAGAPEAQGHGIVPMNAGPARGRLSGLLGRFRRL